MNSNVSIAISQIEKGNCWEALQLLESQKVNSKDSLKLLSLLYQFFGQIDKEMIMLNDNLEFTNLDDYLLIRRVYSKKPTIEKLVPRMVKRIENNSIETLKEIQSTNLFFVSAGNDKYYDLLVECILSLLACPHFEICPICIMDCGLNESNIFSLKIISNRINVVKILPILATHGIVLTSEEIYLGGLVGRGFFNELFPNADYCFYIDADAWIQDESSIVEYLKLAKKQDISLPRHPFDTKVTLNHHWLKRLTLTENQIQSVIGYPAIINCCFCVKIRSVPYNFYCETLKKNVGQFGVKWGIDQEVFLYTAAIYNLQLLPLEYAYEGPFKVKVEPDGTQLLYSGRNNLVKIVHLGGGISKHDRKWIYFHDLEFLNANSSSNTLWSSIHFKIPKKLDYKSLIESLRAFFN